MREQALEWAPRHQRPSYGEPRSPLVQEKVVAQSEEAPKVLSALAREAGRARERWKRYRVRQREDQLIDRRGASARHREVQDRRTLKGGQQREV